MTPEFLLFIFAIPYCAGWKITRKCHQPDPDLYEHTAVLTEGTYGDSTNCYFVVKNADFMILSKNDTRPGDPDDRHAMYTVDVEKARRICHENQAMLPEIMSAGEQEFLKRTYAKFAYWILSNLERATSTGDYIWHNSGHGTFYKNPNWAKLPSPAFNTYTLLMTSDGRWAEFQSNRTWPKKRRFALICHQRSYGSEWADGMPSSVDGAVKRIQKRHSGAAGGKSAFITLITMIIVLILF